MNLRTATRGDAALAASALLLFVSSFFSYYQTGADQCAGSSSDCSTNAWNSDLFPLLPSVFLLGIAGAALVLLGRMLPQEPKPLGIPLRSWGVVLTIASAWSALWSLFGAPSGALFGHPEVSASPQLGAFLAFLFAALNVVFAVIGPVVPALSAPLLPAAGTPAGTEPAPAPQGFGAAPQPHAQPHVGHFTHQPVQQAHPGQPFHGPEPVVAEPPTTPQPASRQPAQAQAAQAQAAQAQAASAPQDTPPALAAEPSAAPAAAPVVPAPPAFSPFWFAVPATRPLAPESNPLGDPVGQLVPGTWYLAIAQHGEALLTQTQEGKRGLLSDTSGIQRG